MSIKKEYWENPDDPEDNGYVFICSACGWYGPDASTHECDPEALKEIAYWTEHYSKIVDGCSQDWDDPVMQIDLEPMKL